MATLQTIVKDDCYVRLDILNGETKYYIDCYINIGKKDATINVTTSAHLEIPQHIKNEISLLGYALFVLGYQVIINYKS